MIVKCLFNDLVNIDQISSITRYYSSWSVISLREMAGSTWVES